MQGRGLLVYKSTKELLHITTGCGWWGRAISGTPSLPSVPSLPWGYSGATFAEPYLALAPYTYSALFARVREFQAFNPLKVHASAMGLE